MMRLLPSTYEVQGEVKFSVYSDPGVVASSPSHNTSTGPVSFLGSTPSPSHNTSTGPRSLPSGNTPVPEDGVSLARDGVPSGYISMGELQDGVPPGQGWGTYTE